jgi:hypothetical protein
LVNVIYKKQDQLLKSFFLLYCCIWLKWILSTKKYNIVLQVRNGFLIALLSHSSIVLVNGQFPAISFSSVISLQQKVCLPTFFDHYQKRNHVQQKSTETIPRIIIYLNFFFFSRRWSILANTGSVLANSTVAAATGPELFFIQGNKSFWLVPQITLLR